MDGWIQKLVWITVGIFFASIIIPIAIDQIMATNTTGWTFPGGVGAITLWQIIGFILVIGVVIGVIAWALDVGKAPMT